VRLPGGEAAAEVVIRGTTLPKRRDQQASSPRTAGSRTRVHDTPTTRFKALIAPIGAVHSATAQAINSGLPHADKIVDTAQSVEKPPFLEQSLNIGPLDGTTLFAVRRSHPDQAKGLCECTPAEVLGLIEPGV
jgi:hypothetical protein